MVPAHSGLIVLEEGGDEEGSGDSEDKMREDLMSVGKAHTMRGKGGKACGN